MNRSSFNFKFFFQFAAVWTVLFSAGFPLEKSLGPVIYSSAQGGYEVYWFYPGLHQYRRGDLDVTPDNCAVPGSADREYAVFSQFRLRPPAAVAEAGMVIVNNDPFPQYPGDQFTPLALALQTEMSADPTTILWKDTVALLTPPTLSGQVITGTPDITISNSFSVWHAMQWLRGFPTAPAAGVSRAHYSFLQFLCAPDEPGFVIQDLPEQYLAGLNLLDWTDHPGEKYLSQGGTIPEFKIIFDPESNPSSSIILYEGLGSDSLRREIQIAEKGYLMVAAVDGYEEVLSDSIFLDPEEKSAITVSPAILMEHFQRDTENRYSFSMKNDDPVPVIQSIKYDSSLLRFESPEFALDANEERDVTFALVKIPDNDTILTTDLIIESQGRRALIYHIVIMEDRPSDIRDENIEAVPREFYVGEPYPNPFNSQVNLLIDIPAGKRVQYTVYDILGREIFKGRSAAANEKKIIWNGIDRDGQSATTGIYFFRIQIDNCAIIRKALLLK
ncbi:hypothetical protein TRIP_C21621 [Candidatus Zixiibacteriota bacterium]|nr:hypothetical protein TRIP_C21621 [candidate division Zixibacteria bacterium]